MTMNSDYLLVGDVYIVSTGMKVPADSILLSGQDVVCDEASLTGEPEGQEKFAVDHSNVEYNPNPFMYAKTLVTQGQGTALVCCVGTGTRSGMAEEKLNIEEEATPM